MYALKVLCTRKKNREYDQTNVFLHINVLHKIQAVAWKRVLCFTVKP